MRWHVFNVIVVLDQGISVNPACVRCLEPSHKDSRVFCIEENVNTVESAFLLGAFPVALISLRFRQEFGNLHPSPVAKAVLIFPETLSSRLLAFPFLGTLFSFCKPVQATASVKFSVVIGLKWKPTASDFVGISKLDILQ